MNSKELLSEIIKLYPDTLNEAIIAVLEESCEDSIKQFPDAEITFLTSHVMMGFEIRWNIFLGTFGNEGIKADHLYIEYRGRKFSRIGGNIVFHGYI